MAQPAAFGLNVDPNAGGLAIAGRIAAIADSAGLEYVGIQDHPYNPEFLDTLTVITWLAAQTRRVHLFPNVANLPLRPPAMLAKQAASIDVLSGGRFELGLGAGAFADGIAGMGGPPRTPGQARAALSEAIDIIRASWAGEPFSFEGTHYRAPGVRPGPRPAHPIGLWLGVVGPRAAALAGAKADGWSVSAPYVPPERLPELNDITTGAALEENRDPERITRLYNVMGLISDEDRGPFHGPAGRWIETLASLYTDYQMNAFVFWPSADRERQSRIWAEEVVPAAREALAGPGRGVAGPGADLREGCRAGGVRPPRSRGKRVDRVSPVEYRTLGRSGLRVSVLTMGTMTFGGTGGFASVGSTGVDEARRQVDMCLDAGVNLIDTADVYSAGLSEEIVGEVLAGCRDDVLVATKVRMPMGDGPNDAGLSRHHIVSGCEASLRRLRTDHIDLYQVHEWDGVTPLEETLAALDLLVRSGKVRYVGVSNYAGWQLMKALGIASLRDLPRFASQQIYYSLQSRDAEYELIPAAVDQGLGVLVWSPLAGGLLSGKYRRDQQPGSGSRQLTDWNEPPVYDQEKLHDTVEVLIEIGAGHGVSAAQVALAYLLRKPAVTSLVIGARTAEQLADNLAAAGLALGDAEMERLDKVSAPTLLYPYWHQAKTARDRLSPADLTLLGPHL